MGQNLLYLLLAKSFIEHNAAGHGQVQAPDIRVAHWDIVTLVLIIIQNVFWQTLGFFAEDQKVAGCEVTCRV